MNAAVFTDDYQMALLNLTLSPSTIAAFCSVAALCLPQASFCGSYDQMVLVLKDKPYYRVHHDARDAVLTIDVRKVSQDELKPLQLYDADLVSRVWLEKLDDQMTRIKLYLKDPAIRYTVRPFNHPFRLSIELFTTGTLDVRDPGTGLPLLPEGEQAAIARRAEPAESMPAAPSRRSQRPHRLVDPGTVVLSAKNPPRRAAVPKPRKRRLLQPIPKLADDPAQRMADLAAIKAGKLTGWESFPPFIYRINTTSYKNSENYKRFLATNKAAPSTLDGLARHAAKQFEFGHEHRSLAAYRYILQNAPALFNSDPLHLWRMAELNLGSHNFALAKGYYQALVQQFPSSEMAGFSKLRLADLLWLPDQARPKPLAVTKAIAQYDDLKESSNGELASAALIRKSFLQRNSQHPARELAGKIPDISESDVRILRRHSNQLDSPKTVFYSRAIALRHLLKHKPAAIATAMPLVKSFVASYRQQPDPKVATKLKSLLHSNVNSEIAKAFQAKDYLGVIEATEALPKNWHVLDKASHFAIAESYRELGQYPAAAAHYQRYRSKEHTLANFIAGFWQLDAQLKSAELLGQDKQAQRSALHKKARRHDRALWQTYVKLSKAERSQAITQLKGALVRLSQNRRFVATPARIVLSVWQHNLLPTAESMEDPSRLPKWQPDGRTVARLTNLKKTFHMQGLKRQSQRVERLLAALDPKLFKDDPVSQKIWTKEILKLAEQYRKDKQFLKAGRMYTLSAQHDDGWEGRAEALYKGGLLLYRAGKRQEAETAFRQASLDVNNVLYAELAKKRLEQISKP